MRVAAIDVGSNTVRLLVATLEDGAVKPVQEERTAVGLAREIEGTGLIPDEKIERAAQVARKYARDAVKLGAARTEVLVTAPARQGKNGSELVDAIADATRLPVRPLSAEEEGRLAFAGVVSTFPVPPASIAVVDVGGGSTQLVYGTAAEGPAWFRTLDIGSLRLAQRHFSNDPPESDELEELRASVEDAFSGHASPLPLCAVATGGTARSLRRVVGRTLGPKQLAEAELILGSAPAKDLAEKFGFPVWRGQTLLAGAFVLAEAQRRLGVPLVVARAGLREGAVLESLLEEQAA
jgi:exopolyphosphatase / guanosine-5'-triphosphate,3'-diphosphate pyrophosphatase